MGLVSLNLIQEIYVGGEWEAFQGAALFQATGDMVTHPAPTKRPNQPPRRVLRLSFGAMAIARQQGCHRPDTGRGFIFRSLSALTTPIPTFIPHVNQNPTIT